MNKSICAITRKSSFLPRLKVPIQSRKNSSYIQLLGLLPWFTSAATFLSNAEFREKTIPGRSGEVATAKNIGKCRFITTTFRNDRNITYNYFENPYDHGYLVMSKVYARWTPKMITPNLREHLDWIIKIIMKWAYRYEPQPKQETINWHRKTKPPLKKFKLSQSAGKFMTTAFWHSPETAIYWSQNFIKVHCTSPSTYISLFGIVGVLSLPST